MKPLTSSGALTPYSSPRLIRIGSYPGIVAMAGGPTAGFDSAYLSTGNFGTS
jgi:hypothetical protein